METLSLVLILVAVIAVSAIFAAAYVYQQKLKFSHKQLHDVYDARVGVFRETEDMGRRLQEKQNKICHKFWDIEKKINELRLYTEMEMVHIKNFLTMRDEVEKKRK